MKKKVKTAQTKTISFKDDWEHSIGLDLNKNTPLKGVTELEEYKKLPKFLQKAYTYQFLSNKCAIAKEVSDKATKLNVDEILNPLAFKIISATVRIRHQKLVLRSDNKAQAMEMSTRTLIHNRQGYLRRLSLEDALLTREICREFGIKMVAAEPRKYAPPDPKILRIKKEVRALRRQKVKAFKEEMEEKAKTFYQNKQDQLAEIERNLSGLNLSIEEVYDEVIAERQERVMLPIHQERYGWFDKEKQLKLHYEKVRHDKKEAKERQQRR